MLFKFPKKQIVLDCFTYDELIMQTAPIAPAMKYVPEWWKNLPATYNENFFPAATTKSCVGIIDYYKKSIALPLWSDLCIDINDGMYKWQFSDGETKTIVHNTAAQAKGLLPNHGHMKIVSPWAFKTKEDIYWTWSQPTYNFDESVSGIKVLPGVINYLRQVSTHINMLVPLNQKRQYMLQHGQVMAHLTPLFDGKVRIERHLISKEKYEQIALQQQKGATFTNIYSNIFKSKQKFTDCPYHKE